jgi:hypothetical protein
MSAETVMLFLGVYMLGGGLALVSAPARVAAMIEGFESQPALSYMTGTVLAVAGTGLLLLFHDFATLWRGVASILGAGMLIEGLMFMAAPRALLALARPFLVNDGIARGAGLLVLVLAAVLICVGLPR